jgi:hypothetical protein
MPRAGGLSRQVAAVTGLASIALLLLAATGCDLEGPTASTAAATAAAQAVPSGEAPDPEPPVAVERRPATASAQKVIDVLAGIEEGLRETRYQHTTRVDERLGLFHWDCSGMTDWVLRRAAPGARRALPGRRPLARDFYRVIVDSALARHDSGWRRVAAPEEICPGDLFAWVKPSFWRHHTNTGHVGFVVDTPRPSPVFPDVWLMRIADATAAHHGDDSRPVGGEGGFGTATMAFLFNARGYPIAYGWYGADQHPQTFVPTKIAFGRVTR